MTVNSFLEFQRRPRSPKRGFGYSLLATPVVYVVSLVFSFIPSAFLPDVTGWAAMAVPVVCAGVLLRAWWWPAISSLPCAGLLVIGALLGGAGSGTGNTDDQGYYPIFAFFFLVIGGVGFVGFGLFGTLGVVVGKLMAYPPADRPRPLQVIHVSPNCPWCKSEIPIGATRCPACSHALPTNATVGERDLDHAPNLSPATLESDGKSGDVLSALSDTSRSDRHAAVDNPV
jgi:hypothetical protein